MGNAFVAKYGHGIVDDVYLVILLMTPKVLVVCGMFFKNKLLSIDLLAHIVYLLGYSRNQHVQNLHEECQCLCYLLVGMSMF